MRLRAYDHSNGRRAEKSVGFRVPAGLLENAMARGGERAKIRDGRTGDKGTAAFRREPEDVEQPAQRYFFKEGRCRSGPPEASVLVPGGREPVSRDRNGKRAADDESEKPRPSHRHRPRRTDLIEQPQRFSRISLTIRERLIKRVQFFNSVRRGSYRAFTDSFQIADRARRSVGKKFFVHDCARRIERFADIPFARRKTKGRKLGRELSGGRIACRILDRQ